MEALLTYLRETRTTPKAFAHLIGIDAGRLDRLLVGAENLNLAIARRMVDATGGALQIEDLLADSAGVVVDLRGRVGDEPSEIDISALTEILAGLLPALVGGARRKGDDRLPGLAAEAAANTFSALSDFTTRSGADRLDQALRPVFAEILEELSAPRSSRLHVDSTSRRAAELYFQESLARRRG